MILSVLLTSSQVQATTSTHSLNMELILSILAIIISLSVAIGEYIWNKKINITNLQSEFYKDIYFKYLMKDIPQARQYIHYNNEELTDVNRLIDVLNSIRQDSLFFKYKDKVFFEKIKKLTQELEEHLIAKEGHMDADTFSDFNSDLNNRIEKLYTSIMDKYNGKR